MKKSRREFLSKMLAASVVTATCPHLLLGKSEPVITGDQDTILGRYYLKFSEYPMLTELWGSVRIQIPPDRTKGFFAPIIVTKLDPAEYGREFSCVYTLCPHEGREVFDFEKQFRQFKCSGHGTIFDADGTYMAGPAAQDLTKFNVFREGDDKIYLDIPAVIDEVSNIESIDNLSYLNPAYPNPANEMATIEYGIENDSYIKLSIFDSMGREISVIDHQYRLGGHYKFDLQLSDLAPAIYLIKLSVNGNKSYTSKLIKSGK